MISWQPVDCRLQPSEHPSSHGGWEKLERSSLQPVLRSAMENILPLLWMNKTQHLFNFYFEVINFYRFFLFTIDPVQREAPC